MSTNIILGYFIPDEWILRFIIMGIIFTLFYVVYKCFVVFFKTRANIAMIEHLADVSFLEDVLKNNKTLDINKSFENFEIASQKTSATEELFDYLRTIYDAGYKSSRLDIDLLIKNTIDKIFAGTDFIKTAISVFLVIGIFGTLMGLAISIGSFSGSSFSITPQATNMAAAAELSNLFSNLKGAFAPSMWGVLCTIITVLGYTSIIQEGCINRLTDKLTVTTIKNWLPKLYPTDFQKSKISLQELNTTIQNADGINNSVTDLQANLKHANETLKSINKVADNLTKTADTFKEATTKVTNFQGQLGQVYQQILSNGEKLQGYVENAVNVVNEFQSKSTQNFVRQADAISKNFAEQNAQLHSIIKELQTHNENYVSSQEELRKNLETSAQSSADAALNLKNATEGLVSRGDNTVKAVAEPIKTELASMSGNVNGNLAKISTELTRISNPLQSSAVSIQKMFENVVKEIEDRTQVMEKKMDERSTNMAAIMENCTKKMLEEMDKRTDAMHEEIKVLAAAGGGKASPEVLTALTNNTGNRAIENKLDKIATCLINQRDIAPVEEEKDIFTIFKELLPLVLAILLVISIGVQMVMVSRIGDLQKSQSAVTEILLKGEKTAQ